VGRPLIGITAYVEDADWGIWRGRTATLVPHAYVLAVYEAGGRPVVVPPLPDAAEETVAGLDGLLLAGGADLTPALYGAEPDPATTGTRPDRDAGELPLLRAATAADLPVLGVCRGMQLMVAESGGSLVQDVRGHRAGIGEYSRHAVDTVPGTRLAGLVGSRLDVASYHHQGIASPGSLTVGAHAGDGTVEAVEEPAARFRVGVLWHPEHDPDRRLFAGLVAAAGA
jgi:putative glutamine amidotransferase